VSRRLRVVQVTFDVDAKRRAPEGLLADRDTLVETAIGLSVVAFGLAVAAGYRLPASTAMALAGFFALFHGYAHGAEMPGSLSGLDYAAGFVLAMALLHVAGAGTAITAAKLGHVFGERALRSAGGLIALVGVGTLLGNL